MAGVRDLRRIRPGQLRRNSTSAAGILGFSSNSVASLLSDGFEIPQVSFQVDSGPGAAQSEKVGPIWPKLCQFPEAVCSLAIVVPDDWAEPPLLPRAACAGPAVPCTAAARTASGCRVGLARNAAVAAAAEDEQHHG